MPYLKRLANYADLLPISLMVIFSFYFSLNVPISDDWDYVPIIAKMQMRHGMLDWAALNTPYAGHKLVIPYLVLGWVAMATHWNTFAFRCLNIGVFLGSWLAIRPFAVLKGRLLPASILFWNWNQWVAWIFTAAMPSNIAILFALWSLRFHLSAKWPAFLVGMLLAFCATLSHGTGLAVWPAALYLIFFKDRPPLQRALFLLLTAVAAIVFLYHPATNANVSAEFTRGNNYLNMPLFFLFGLGAPIAYPTWGTSAVAAFAGLLALIFWTAWRETNRRSFVTAVLIASLAMMFLVMMARGGGSDIIGGADSRYGPLSGLFWTALVLLVDWSGWKRFALGALLALCIIRDFDRFPAMVACKRSEEKERRTLIDWTPDRYLFKGDYTSRQQFDSDVKLMRDWHYSLFHDQ